MPRKKKETIDDTEIQIAFENALNNAKVTKQKSTFAAHTEEGDFHVTVEKIS